MIRQYIPTLITVSLKLSTRKSKIVEYWTSSPMVLEILKTHNIDIDLFKSEYAIKILDYYFGVVDQTKEIGDCPVMADFLIYLKDHDITCDWGIKDKYLGYLIHIHVIYIGKKGE